jgi:23S rRNA pseudouridine1911/1915/1917 synthase
VSAEIKLKTPKLKVLYEDNHLLAIAKPPGIATMGVPAGTLSLLDVAKQYIKQKYDKPGNVYLGVVSRLDAPVTGVLLIARTSKAASRLTEQFRNKSVEKLYWAVVDGMPDAPEGTCVDWVRKDERHRKMHIATESSPNAKQARLSYRVLQAVCKGTLLEVRLETGRKHQIRLQLSHCDMPIIGDRKYGSMRSFPAGIALHSRFLRFQHPVLKTEIELTAELPSSWHSFGVSAFGVS